MLGNFACFVQRLLADSISSRDAIIVVNSFDTRHHAQRLQRLYANATSKKNGNNVPSFHY